MTNIIEQTDNVAGMKTLPDECVDLTVTSPPYDNLRKYNGFSWDEDGVINELYRVTKRGGVVVWIVNDATVGGSETLTSFRQAIKFREAGFNLHDTMIWEKPTFTATGSLAVRYAPVFEYMFVFSKGKPKSFHPIKDKPNKYSGTNCHGTVRNPDGSMKPVYKSVTISEYGQRTNVWNISGCNSAKERSGHPAQFPLKLAEDHIISWSDPGDTVLDPFLGSGTTAVAAIKTGRRYIGFEISAEYVEMAKKRIAEAEDDAIHRVR